MAMFLFRSGRTTYVLNGRRRRQKRRAAYLPLIFALLALTSASALAEPEPRPVCSGRGTRELVKSCQRVLETAEDNTTKAEAFVELCKAQAKGMALQLIAQVIIGTPSIEAVGVKYCDKALEIVPDYIPALKERARAMRFAALIPVFAPLKTELHARAQRDIERMTEAWPGKWEAWVERASGETMRGDKQAAWASLEKAFSLAPNQYQVHFVRTGLLLQQEHPEEARASLLKAIELGGEKRRLLMAAAKLFLTAGDKAQALSFYSRAIAGEKAASSEEDTHLLASSYAERGWLLLDAGDSEKAKSDFKKALALDNSNNRAWEGIKKVTNNQLTTSEQCKQSGPDPETIIRVCTAAMEYAWDYDEMERRARAYVSIGKYALAIADYTAMLDRDPDWAGYYTERARAYRANNMYREALADIDTYIDSVNRPHEPSWVHLERVQRAEVLCYLDRYDDALAEYSRIISEEPQHVFALIGRAEILYRLGRIDEAARDAGRALAINPKTVDARTLRGAILARSGNIAEARAELSIAAQGKFCLSRDSMVSRSGSRVKETGERAGKAPIK